LLGGRLRRRPRPPRSSPRAQTSFRPPAGWSWNRRRGEGSWACARPPPRVTQQYKVTEVEASFRKKGEKRVVRALSRRLRPAGGRLLCKSRRPAGVQDRWAALEIGG